MKQLIAKRNDRLLTSLANMAKFYNDNGRPTDGLRVLNRYNTLRNRLNFMHSPV